MFATIFKNIWGETRPSPAMLAAALILICATSSSRCAEPVTVSVSTRQPGTRIPQDALGVSYETSVLLPDARGVRYFRPDNKPLVTAFRTLGIKNLRTGGNSVDAANIPVPNEADVQSLFEFARAAGVRVIFSVRLKDGDPQLAAKFAKLIHDKYADVLDTFAIGNEPYYYKDYAVYTNKWLEIRDAILAVYPEAQFCGPDQNPHPELITEMVRDFGNSAGRLVQITQHQYPFGCAYQNYRQVDITKLDPVDATTNRGDGPVLIPYDPAQSRAKMMLPSAYASYEKVRAGMADAIAGTEVTFRLTEVNSFWFSGLKGASDSFASALWGLDYLHWWTAHGAAGLNFHTGDRTGGTVSMPCRYAVLVTSANGYEIRPLGYGLKLFELAGHGRTLPVEISSAPEQGLVAYTTLSESNSVAVTLINKMDTQADVRIKLDAPAAAGSSAQAIFLTTPNHDLAAGSSDVRLGGAPIREDGTWKGTWTSVPLVEARDAVTLTLPPFSAVAVQIPLPVLQSPPGIPNRL